jgi:hypothetical protein
LRLSSPGDDDAIENPWSPAKTESRGSRLLTQQPVMQLKRWRNRFRLLR